MPQVTSILLPLGSVDDETRAIADNKIAMTLNVSHVFFCDFFIVVAHLSSNCSSRSKLLILDDYENAILIDCTRM